MQSIRDEFNVDEKKLLELCAESLNSAQQVWLAKQILARHPKTLIEPDATQEIAAASGIKHAQDQSIDEEALTRIHVQPESESKIKSPDPKSESPNTRSWVSLGAVAWERSLPQIKYRRFVGKWPSR